MGVWLSSIVAFTNQLGNAIKLLSFFLYMNASMRKKKFALKIFKKNERFQNCIVYESNSFKIFVA